MRSAAEIVFRLKQEFANLNMYLRPPRLPENFVLPAVLPLLPDPQKAAERIRGTEFEVDLLQIAHSVAEHRFPLLGYLIEADHEIHWRRDYVHGQETSQGYFRRIPYLNFEKAGDHKVIWELNRQQHWIVLAQAFRITGDQQWLDALEAQARDWFAQNPMHSGINWTSALEVAFRLLSWLWVCHLAGGALSPEMRQRLAEGIYQHALHLEYNLSIYFSPNTHLLGEAIALHAVAKLIPELPDASKWATLADRIVAAHVAEKVRADGSYFEQSAYYQVYALDMMMFHSLLGGTVSQEVIRRMSSYLAALLGPSRILPMLGDDDGGRFFYPYGSRLTFARATLATASCMLDESFGWTDRDLHQQACWWLPRVEPPPGMPDYDSNLFADAGIAVLFAEDNQVIIDAGPFGAGSAGHSHSDTLSILARCGDEEVLIDPGTFTYVAEPAWRDLFRGTGAHSTIRINNMEQAKPAGPFRWISPPDVKVTGFTSSSTIDLLSAECSYAGFKHRRRVRFVKPYVVFVLDEVEGGPGMNLIEQYWHLGSPESESRLQTAGPGFREYLQGGEFGWRSEAFGVKEQAVGVRISYQGELPVRIGAVLDLSPKPSGATLLMDRNGDEILLSYGTASSRFLPAE